MCGLCGYVDFVGRHIDEHARRAMVHALRHRGPDAEGEHDLKGAHSRGWMGHRRLKILDLSHAAHQPMANARKSAVLSYNGEVYNFRDLRRELIASGCVFQSSGDTEVVLRAYEAWGPDFVERLDGMFALAIWDANAERLLLARDRSGKKPLFYADLGGTMIFASEIKSILLSALVPRRLARDRLPAFLTFGYVLWPDTLFEGVQQVPPASWLTYDRDGLSGPTRYWELVPTVQHLEPSRATLEAVRRRLRKAVQRRMVADVPMGALLSGGLDSSIVVGLMSAVAQEPVHTFSIGFPEDESFDERPHARKVAQHFGTRHREFAVKMDAVALLDRLLWYHDQPFVDSSAIPTYLVSRLAREHVTVVLNGDGGDEVFGGYERFAAASIAARLPGQIEALAAPLVRLLPRTHGYHSMRRRLERFIEQAGAPVLHRYRSWIAVFNDEMLAQVLHPALGAHGSMGFAMQVPDARARHLPELDQILFANFVTYLPDDLAVKMDRMSMAHSLETRSPFLDTALIELMAQLPARHKVGIRHLKPVLRKAFYSILPPEIWQRRKHGFGVPMEQWMRSELGEVFADEVLGSSARCGEFLDRRVLQHLFDQQRRGLKEHGYRLWTVLTLERWLRSLERPADSEPPGAPAVVDADDTPVGMSQRT